MISTQNPTLKKLLWFVLFVFMGLVSTIVLEVGVVPLLTYAPPSIDLGGGFYNGVAAVLLVLLVLFGLAFAGVLRRGPRGYVLLYAVSFFLSHHALLARRDLLGSLTSPTPTQTTYNLLIGGGCLLLIVWVWWRRRNLEHG